MSDNDKLNKLANRVLGASVIVVSLTTALAVANGTKKIDNWLENKNNSENQTPKAQQWVPSPSELSPRS